jgi:hypothetical protein
VTPFAVVMLLAAVVLVGAVHAGKLPARLTLEGRKNRKRVRRKAALRIVESDPDDDFAAAVERDLAALPTIDDRDN